MVDRHRFRFKVNGRTADASAIGTEHVGLALSADGIAISLVVPAPVVAPVLRVVEPVSA